MTEFEKLLDEHQKLIQEYLGFIQLKLKKKGQIHDQDKLTNKTIYESYNTYFSELKKISFGTKEYLDFEKKNFSQAHLIHAQNRHHFYSPLNKTTKPNLIDFIEAVVDIYVSNIQYNNKSISDEQILTSMLNKGLGEYKIEDLILTTITELNTYKKE